MEFEFVRNTLMGEYYVKASMGHEVIARWLQEEIGKDKDKLQKVEDLIALSQKEPQQEHLMLGTEISLSICGDEVSVEENILKQDAEYQGEEDFSHYNSESTACCGLEDFSDMIQGWKGFVFD